MNFLALDLGTNTGAAFGIAESRAWELDKGTNLVKNKDERTNRRLDPRHAKLWDLLCAAHECRSLDYIIFEDVQFGKSLAQVQLWSSFRGVVWAFAHHHFIPVECLDTWKLKQFATGTAHADKCAMARALVKQHPTVYTLEEITRTVKKFRVKFSVARRVSDGTLLTDDEVDAIHLFTWAQNYIKV
jgi:Holliday junction resolvasome RuvABC endonuclease subunit